MTRVKICGITRLSDAQAAIKAGADAVGFIFAKSPRRVSEKQAKAIAGSLGAVTKIGVFVNTPVSAVANTMKYCGLDAIQLHGDEPLALMADLPKPCIKAFRLVPSTEQLLLERPQHLDWLRIGRLRRDLRPLGMWASFYVLAGMFILALFLIGVWLPVKPTPAIERLRRPAE